MKLMTQITFSTLFVFVGLSSLSFAGETTPAAAKHPCRKIETACSAAGFIKRHHKEGKGLWKDCMEPIMEGKTVEGVTVDAADIQGCKDKRAAKKKP